MPNIHDLDVTQYLYDCVNINDLDLDREMRQVSADLVYWNHRFGDAVKAALNTKLQAKMASAQAWQDALAFLVNSNASKTSEKAIEARANLDPVWVKAKEKEADAEADQARLRGICDAVAGKRDMLRSLAAKLRKEMETDPSVVHQQRLHRSGGGDI
jgi:hypothetical protein